MERGDVSIRVATAQDARLVAAAVDACYGSTYIDPALLRPEHVAREIGSGAVVYALATDRAGRYLASAALSRVAPDLWECGRVMVAREWRGSGLCNRLSDHLVFQVAPAVGARFVMGRMVTSHVFVQRHGVSRGLVPTGMLMGIAPQTFTAAGIAPPTQAVSMIVALRRCEATPRERRITLRGRDRRRSLELLARLGVPARPRGGARDPAPGGSLEWLPNLGITRLRFGDEPAGRTTAELLDQSALHAPRVEWADVPSEHPGAPALVEELRARGFGWAAYIPIAGPRGEDVLRLQRLAPTELLELEAIQVLDELRPLRDEIYAELHPTGVCA